MANELTPEQVAQLQDGGFLNAEQGSAFMNPAAVAVPEAAAPPPAEPEMVGGQSKDPGASMPEPVMSEPPKAAGQSMDLAAPQAPDPKAITIPGTVIDSKEALAPEPTTIPETKVEGVMQIPTTEIAGKAATAASAMKEDLNDERADIESRNKLLNEAQDKETKAKIAANDAAIAGHQEALLESKKSLDADRTRRAEINKQQDIDDAQSEKRAREVASRKIDPNRVFHEMSAPQAILGILSQAFGAFGASLSHGPNYAADMLNNQINRDVAAQRDDIQNAKDGNAALEALSKKKYGRAMDQQEFDARSRIDQFNTANAMVDNQVKKYNSPIMEAQAETIKQHNNAEIAKERLTISQNEYTVRSTEEAKIEAARKAKAAAAGAGANQALKKQEELQKEYRQRTEDFIKEGIAPQQAQAMALKLISGDSLGGMSGKPSKEGSAESKAEETQTGSTEFNKQIDNMKKSTVFDHLGEASAASLAHKVPGGAAMLQRVHPESEKTLSELNTLNTQMLQSLGKVAKDADGKPNAAMLEELKHTYSIQPTDSKEIALQKLENARETVNALALQQGASAPTPNDPHKAEAFNKKYGIKLDK